MTSRTISSNVFDDLSKEITDLERRLAALENIKVPNLRVVQSTELPAGHEGDMVMAKDNSTAYIFIGGVWVAVGSGGGGSVDPPWTNVIVKTTDESVSSSTTLQDDNELQFTTVSGTVYYIEYYFFMNSPVGGTTPGIKCSFGEDTTTRGFMEVWRIGTAPNIAGQNIATNLSSAAAAQGATSTAIRPIWGNGFHTGNGGLFRFQWAQLTSNANATVVKAKSTMRIRAL